jgi:hypothetical protein
MYYPALHGSRFVPAVHLSLPNISKVNIVDKLFSGNRKKLDWLGSSNLGEFAKGLLWGY